MCSTAHIHGYETVTMSNVHVMQVRGGTCRRLPKAVAGNICHPKQKHSSGKCRPYQALRKAARLPLFLKQGSQAMPALPTLISTAPPHPNEASFQTFA